MTDFPDTQALQGAWNALHNLEAQYQSYGTLKQALQVCLDAAQGYQQMEQDLLHLAEDHRALQMHAQEIAQSAQESEQAHADACAAYAADFNAKQAAGATTLADLAAQIATAHGTLDALTGNIATAQGLLDTKTDAALLAQDAYVAATVGKETALATRDELVSEIATLMAQRDTLEAGLQELLGRIQPHDHSAG